MDPNFQVVISAYVSAQLKSSTTSIAPVIMMKYFRTVLHLHLENT